jgi:xylan 1,4-beta-xylosidase
VRLEIASLPAGAYWLSMRRTGYQANDAYSQYIAWGLPDALTADQIATLQTMTTDRPEAQTNVRVGADGLFARDLTLRTNDAVLVTLDPIA